MKIDLHALIRTNSYCLHNKRAQFMASPSEMLDYKLELNKCLKTAGAVGLNLHQEVTIKLQWK